MPQPARQRPLYPSEIIPLKKSRQFDGQTLDGLRDRSTVDLSVNPSKHPSTRRLTEAERRFALWLETRCAATIPQHLRPYSITNPYELPAFVGARRLILKFGGPNIAEALRDMIDIYDDGRRWKPAIVSPAQYLNWYLRQLHPELA